MESQGYENLQPTSYLPATQGPLITAPPLITQGSSSSYLPTETPLIPVLKGKEEEVSHAFNPSTEFKASLVT